jgi:hypothetical protein
MFRSLISSLLIVGLVGCASVPMGDPKQDAALKEFSSKSGVAGIYVYRNESFGGAVTMSVDIDGRVLGKTASNTFLYKEVKPGKHTVTSEAENSDSLVVNAVAGKLYYIWQEVKMGLLSARSKLHLVGAEEGKKGVLETNLAATR